jgi:hypothetical protein
MGRVLGKRSRFLMIFNAITVALDVLATQITRQISGGNTKNGPYECREALNKSSLSALLLKSANHKARAAGLSPPARPGNARPWRSACGTRGPHSGDR